MKSIGTIGRILYGLVFMIFGLFHFMQSSTMAQAVLSGWPVGRILVLISGIALLLGGLSILIRTMVKWGMLLLGILMFVFVFAVHVPALIGAEESQVMQMALTSLLKDTALGGAAWFIGSIYSDE